MEKSVIVMLFEVNLIKKYAKCALNTSSWHCFVGFMLKGFLICYSTVIKLVPLVSRIFQILMPCCSSVLNPDGTCMLIANFFSKCILHVIWRSISHEIERKIEFNAKNYPYTPNLVRCHPIQPGKIDDFLKK